MAAETRRTTCSRDCPDACSIVATVEGGRVVRLAGDRDHPVTRGFLCFRTSRFVERQDAPDRLRQPLLRKEGRLVPVTMDEALDVAAERLLRIRAESGPEAILHYRSGGSLGMLKLVADRFFERFGPCATKIGDICSGAGEAAQEVDFGVSDSNDLFDLLHSRYVWLWGKNPAVSAVHLVPVLKEARARGAFVTLADPVRTRSAPLADRVVTPRPGADLEMTLGIGRALFDSGAAPGEAGSWCENLEAYRALVHRRDVAGWAAAADVDPGLLRGLAAELVEGPTAILVGWGMQRRARGAAIVRALDALSAVSGNLFRSGGGCSFYYRRRAPFDTKAVAAGPEAAPRHAREPLLGRDVLEARDPPIRAIWVTAGNPVAMLPDAAEVARAFESREFVVVADPFLTDTGRRASLVLPVPTLLEDSDLLGAYGHHWLGESRPVVPPPEGVLHEVDLFLELARRVGLEAEMAGSVDDWKRRLLADGAGGVALHDLRRGAVRDPARGPLLFPERRVATPSGKVRLLDECPPPPPDEPGYPLWLFSSSTAKSQSSQWAGRGPGDHLPVRLHPSAAPGRDTGELVWLESPRGRLRARLELDADLRPDAAVVPKGGHLDRGQCANSLIGAVPTDLGLGAAYLDCRVRVR